MKTALYAGSFDPWTYGHQFVLNSALEVFDCIHIVIAINPSKQSLLSADARAQIIAHTIDPDTDRWSSKSPFCINNKIVVTAQEGLIADYAYKNNIKHLIRGLRSTTDFESEFNLYFSNHAINSALQTWAIMCPPSLLHCSATYVKTVVGKQNVKFVGTPFAAQALMLGWERLIGQIFDLIQKHSTQNSNGMDLSASHLQLLFTEFFHKYKKIPASKMKEMSQLFHSSKEKDLILLWEILSLCAPNGMDDVKDLLKDAGFKQEHVYVKNHEEKKHGR